MKDEVRFKLIKFIDKYGAIGHHHAPPNQDKFEYGDSARETGTYFILEAWTKNAMLHVLKNAFLDKDGSLCRHKYSEVDWHRDPKEFSRDQWTAIACAVAKRRVDTHSLEMRNILLREQLKHPFTAQNGDLITWEWNLYYRMYRRRYWWVCILDFGLVVNSIIRVIKNRIKSDDVGDDINQTSMLYVAIKVMPTPFSWLARMIYKYFHPGVQKAWDHYYRHPENPPLNLVWRETISKWF